MSDEEGKLVLALPKGFGTFGAPRYGSGKSCIGCVAHGMRPCATPCEGFKGKLYHKSRGASGAICGPQCREHAVTGRMIHATKKEIAGSIQLSFPPTEKEGF